MNSWVGWEQYDELPARDPADRWIDWAAIVLVLAVVVFIGVVRS